MNDSPAAAYKFFAAVVPNFRRPPNARIMRSRQRFCGQVAQVVERSPEKAGVGGSTPSLATTNPSRQVGFRLETNEHTAPCNY